MAGDDKPDSSIAISPQARGVEFRSGQGISSTDRAIRPQDRLLAKDPFGQDIVTTPKIILASWLPKKVRDTILVGLPSGLYRFTDSAGTVVVWTNHSGGLYVVEYYAELPTDFSVLLKIAKGNADSAGLLKETFDQYNRDMRYELEEFRLSPSSARAKLHKINDEALKLTIESAAAMITLGPFLSTLKQLGEKILALSKRSGSAAELAVGASAKSLSSGALQSAKTAAKKILSELLSKGKAPKIDIGGKGSNVDYINLNPLYDGPHSGIPNLVQAPGESMAELFPAGSIEEIVSENLVAVEVGIDWNQIARAAFRVMKSGASISLHAFSQETSPIVDALREAGFKNITIFSSLVSGVKP
jgi:hypothetical protein